MSKRLEASRTDSTKGGDAPQYRPTEAQIYAFRSEWKADGPDEPEWLQEEMRLLNWLCALGLAALRSETDADCPSKKICEARHKQHLEDLDRLSALSAMGTSAVSKDDLLRAAIACEQIWAMDLGERLRAAAEGCVVPREHILRDVGYIAANNIVDGAESADAVDATRIRAMARLLMQLAAAPGGSDE